MRKPIIAGNWKMNGSRASVSHLLEKIKMKLGTIQTPDIVIFPPCIFLEQTSRILMGSSVAWGAQNVSSEMNGAFTGEISAEMLVDFHCSYVIVGHSERRTLFGEDDATIAKKFWAAQKASLTPILCIGETLHQREQGQTEEVVIHQLSAVLTKGGDFKKAVIAYEPIWAIGTGLTATPEQAQQVHAVLRQEIRRYDEKVAQEIRIVYGGSVKSTNAESLFAMPDIDGALVGNASLDSDEFAKICG